MKFVFKTLFESFGMMESQISKVLKDYPLKNIISISKGTHLKTIWEKVKNINTLPNKIYVLRERTIFLDDVYYDYKVSESFDSLENEINRFKDEIQRIIHAGHFQENNQTFKYRFNPIRQCVDIEYMQLETEEEFEIRKGLIALRELMIKYGADKLAETHIQKLQNDKERKEQEQYELELKKLKARFGKK